MGLSNTRPVKDIITDDTITKDVRYLDGIKWICLFVLTGEVHTLFTVKKIDELWTLSLLADGIR
jgi:hypothetical protein